MHAIFSVTAAFFALVLMGWIAVRRRWMPGSAIGGLNAFLLYFAVPCLLFRFGRATPFAQLLDPSLLLVYGSSALLMVFFTIAMTVQRRRHGPGVGLRDSAFGALLSAFPNTGFMGVPLIVAIAGERAAGPVIATILTDLFLTTSICIAVAQLQPPLEEPNTAPADTLGDALDDAEDRRRARQAPFDGPIARSFASALGNPLPWAIALGAAASVSNIAFPRVVETVLGMLADAATPVALFTIGAMLVPPPDRAGRRSNQADALALAIFKLALHPAVVLAFGIIGHALGVPLSAAGLTVLVLAAALPGASSVALLGERYGADSARLTTIIMYSTFGAAFSFSLLSWLLVPSAR